MKISVADQTLPAELPIGYPTPVLWFGIRVRTAAAKQQVPPLRYAPVGMTNLFRCQNFDLKINLSSRPERSAVEGPAVSFLPLTQLRLELAENLQLRNVVKHDESGKDKQHHEGRLVNPLLELLVQVAAHDAFDQ
jgi:hypothetical protein